MKETVYKEIRNIINNFIKKDYWNAFCSADIFYFNDSKKKKTMVTFLDSFFGESYGLQFFINNDGFNYVHDIFTSKNPDMISIGDCDSICAVLTSKENLSPEDVQFLKDCHARIKEENNLIIYRFKKGYAQRLANVEEMNLILERLGYLNSIIANEYNDIIEAFEQGLSVVAFVNLEDYLYNVSYIPLPYLEKNPKLKPINKAFISEYQNKPFLNDECYLFTSYLPIIIKETGVRPILLYFYFEDSNKTYLKFIIDEPKTYYEYIFGILDEVFIKYGKPIKMIFNNRDFFYYTKKTLTELNIECDKTFNNDYVDDNISNVISKVFEKTGDEVIEKESAALLLIETLTKVLNEIDLYENEEDNKTSNLVS